MRAISVQLSRRLRRHLLDCGPFAADSTLQAVFSDERINPWRDWVPQASTAAERVEATIDFLTDKYDAEQRNALALFLRVLSERLDERDSCHGRLMTLAGEVAEELPFSTDQLSWPLQSSTARVFLCYSRRAKRDEALALFLHGHLTERGHQVFMDRTMRTGTDWLRRIDEEIRSSDFLLVLLSHLSADSEMVQAEVRRAYEYRRTLGRPQTLPVRLDFDDPLPYTLDFFLNPLQYVVWRDETDNARIAQEIDAALSGQLPDKPLISVPDRDTEIDGRRTVASARFSRPLPAVDPRFLEALEAPGGTLRLEDEFYVQRSADLQLIRQVDKRGTTTTIRAPRQSGKSSLLVRGIHHARQQHGSVVYLDLQRVDQAHLASADNFLRYLATFIAQRLDLETESVERAWQGPLGAQDKLSYWLEGNALNGRGNALTLAMDEVDRLLESPFHNDFFALMRSWHNNRALDESWSNFNLIMVISTEPYLLISEPAQSPFNVGLKLYLEDFEPDQLDQLNRRHGSPVRDQHLAEFIRLFGGHPYLTRMALYTLVVSNPSWQEFVKIAPTDQGPFADHLRRYQWLLREEPSLRAALKQVIRQKRCNDEAALFRLLRAGLIKGSGGFCICRCDLYRLYFSEKLS